MNESKIMILTANLVVKTSSSKVRQQNIFAEGHLNVKVSKV